MRQTITDNNTGIRWKMTKLEDIEFQMMLPFSKAQKTRICTKSIFQAKQSTELQKNQQKDRNKTQVERYIYTIIWMQDMENDKG